MWKRKDLTKKDGGVTYEAELMARMEEQFREGKRKSDPNAENDDDNDDEKEEGEETENKNNENFVKSSGENEENEMSPKCTFCANSIRMAQIQSIR